MLNLSEKQTQRIIWTLLLIFPIIGMAIDLVAPSLPAISNNLRVSSSLAKNVITLYLVGYALGNSFTGFLTDAFGRQKLIRLGLLGFSLASLIPVFFDRIDMLLLSRLLQGITMGIFSVVSRAVFADILPKEKLTHLGTWIGTMWGLGPVIGPVIGGYLQFYFNWQAGFIFFAVVSFIGLIATWFIVPETHFNKHALKINTIKNNIKEVLACRLFIALVFLMGISYSLLIIFNTAGPFLIQNIMYYSPVFFGHVALWLGLVFLISTFIGRAILKKIKMEKILFFTINIFLGISILSVLISFYVENAVEFTGVLSAFMFFACGIIFPMSMGKGISFFKPIVGTATAVMYLIQILMTSLVSFIVSFIHVKNNSELMFLYFILLLIATIIYWSMIYKKESKA